MTQPKASRVQVLMYVILVFAFSSFFYFLVLHSGSLGYGRGMYVLGLMWCPALAGMLTLRLNRRSISELGWKWGETKYQIRSWYIPLLYAAIAYAIVWILHLGAFGNPDFLDSLVKAMHLGGPRWISIVLGIVWTGAILHGSHNLYIQAIFTPITRDTGRTKWFIDEFGCVIPIVVLFFAIYFWSKRRELPTV